MGTKARVLTVLPLDGLTLQANQVVLLDDKQAKELEKAGVVDTNKESVAYALSENGSKVVEYIPLAQKRETLEGELADLEKAKVGATEDQQVAIGAQIAEKQAALAALQ